MAACSIRSRKCLQLSLLLLITITMVCCTEARKKMQETKMVFYMQDWESPPDFWKPGVNWTAVPIAGINGRFQNVLNFTSLFVMDNALTEGLDRNSKEMARGQGIYVNSALGGTDLHLIFSAVFTNEQYKGSTLEFQGADRWNYQYREVSVVSGTGLFRYARGYAILETVYLDIVGFNAVIRFNVTVRHY
uniref:Dirigent protein n=1 Tax=Kadsura heteroclita TaxID=124781 RepID=A0A7U3VH19_9MAGN|nr:dirigent protein 17 [Kadsura heteroclita]